MLLPVAYGQTNMSQTNPSIEQTGSNLVLYWNQTGDAPGVRLDIRHYNQTGYSFAGT